jgi:nicotinamidase-related amidase
MPSAALIVIDMLNTYEHEDAERLVPSVQRVLPAISELVGAAGDADLLTVYVNDNYGDWSAGREELSERARAGAHPELVDPIVPPERTPFVVKARHSIFYETQLEYLLRSQEVEQLVLTGQVTEQCVLYSALDGYVRHFDVVVARDAVAHIYEDLAEAALRMMERNMRAEIVGSASEGLEAVRRLRSPTSGEPTGSELGGSELIGSELIGSAPRAPPWPPRRRDPARRTWRRCGRSGS